MYFSQWLCNFFCVKPWWHKTAFFLFFFFFFFSCSLQTTPLTSEHSKSKSHPTLTLGRARCRPAFDSKHASYFFSHIFENDKAMTNDKEMLPLVVLHIPWEQAAVPPLSPPAALHHSWFALFKKKKKKTKKNPQPPSNTFLNTPPLSGLRLHKTTWGSCFCDGPWQQTKGTGRASPAAGRLCLNAAARGFLLNTDSKGFNLFLLKAICQIQK